MKRFFLFIFISCILIMNGYAQKKTFTLEDLLPGGTTYSKFIPKTESTFRFYGDNLTLQDGDSLFLVNPKKTDEKKVLITTSELKQITGNEFVDVKQLSFGKLDNRFWGIITLGKENKRLYIDLETKKIAFEINLKNEWRGGDFCRENRSFAFSKGNNLYITNGIGEPFVVAEDENLAIVYGQAVHRNEFGIQKGTFWSPNGNFLAFYRMDESMVEDYPLVDISAREAKLKNAKYPMAGMTSHEVTLGIYTLQSGKTIFLKTEEQKDHYLTCVSWDPSEKYIYLAELNREQNHLQLNQYDVASGEKIKTLFEEKSNKYVEPENPLLFLKKTPNQFIWQSERDGFNHLYLFNTEGKLIKKLTSGAFDVTRVLGLDENEKSVFYISNESNPIDFHAYNVDLKSGKKTQLTFESGVHNPTLSENGKYLLDRYSNLTTPLVVELIDTNNPKKSKTLQKAESPYTEYEMPEISLGSIKAADGKTDIYYRMLKPSLFDPNKKYPTVIYVYGGPHSQGVRNNWMGSTRGWEIYMAQKGYVIFTVDNRGTSNRGLEFEQVTHRQLGIHETEDQMCGVNFLKSLPFVDPDRIGVHGWSYGGFMTTNMMLRHPEVFKVGVAGGPVMDWKYYEIMYGERYMSSPQNNPEGYKKTSMLNKAGNLKGKLLIIHGDEDPTVVMQNSLSFLKACISARTYPDFFVYPGHGHNMMGPDRIHLHEKITQYFEDYLK